MKTKKDYDFYLKRFQEVVCFLTAVGIKKRFKTVEEYRKARNSSKAYYLNIAWEILRRLSRLPFGKQHAFENFVEQSKTLFVYHRHCHKKFKTKKHFSRNSWFELSESTLNKWFENEENLNTKTCKLIGKESHKWIDKYVYGAKFEKIKEEKKPEINTVDDIPSDEEILAQKKKTLSYRLQEFHNKGYLQCSEAERIRRHSIYADELPKIKDSGITYYDTSKHLDARQIILNNILNHPTEWKSNCTTTQSELGRWCSAVKENIAINVKQRAQLSQTF